MKLSYDENLVDVFDVAFDEPGCYMLLADQDLGYWQGQIEDMRVIYGLKDLAIALYDGLAAFGFERDCSKKIKIENQNDGRILIDVPSFEKLIPKEQGYTKFVLLRLKGFSADVGE